MTEKQILEKIAVELKRQDDIIAECKNWRDRRHVDEIVRLSEKVVAKLRDKLLELERNQND
jgi:hypothetical protein